MSQKEHGNIMYTVVQIVFLPYDINFGVSKELSQCLPAGVNWHGLTAAMVPFSALQGC